MPVAYSSYPIARLEYFAMAKAFLSLPARQLDIMLLRYYSDLSAAEIAARMEISTGAVKRHVRSGLRALQSVSDPRMPSDVNRTSSRASRDQGSTRQRWTAAMPPGAAVRADDRRVPGGAAGLRHGQQPAAGCVDPSPEPGCCRTL